MTSRPCPIGKTLVHVSKISVARLNEILMTKYQDYGERSARPPVSVWQMVLGVAKSEKAYSVKELQMVTYLP